MTEAIEKSTISQLAKPDCGAKMPCGTLVTNVYDAYEAGKRAALAEQPAQQEPVAWLCTDYDGKAGIGFTKDAAKRDAGELCHDFIPLYTSPPAQRTWVDPNDKTQKQYLPQIGEPILFCHGGKTYIGKHNGGSFQTEGDYANYFDTWECHWMHLPVANNIKEQP